MYRKLILTLPDDNLVLTPNRRLALTLIDSHHEATQHTVSQPLSTTSLQDWLSERWRQLSPTQALLSAFEEQLLWQTVIRSDKHELLLPTDRIAQQAMRSYQLIESYTIQLTADDMLTHHDGECFLRWLNAFQTECEQRQVITEAALPKALMTHGHALSLPKHIVLVGFVDPPPVIRKLFDQLSEHCNVTWHQPEPNETQALRAIFSTPEAEIKAMAAWAKRSWQAHPHPEQCRIACVVPNLTEEKNRLSRLLSDVLCDDGDLFSQKPPFNLSQGLALLDYPMIKTALNCFQAHNNHRDVLLLSQLLCNPYLTSYTDSDAAKAAQVDTTLRQSGQTHISNDSLLIALQAATEEEEHSALRERWQAFLDHPVQRKPLLPSEWCDVFTSLLHCIGWPGQDSLRSDEFQLRERFQSSLLHIAGLDDLLGVISRDQFADVLHQYCSQQVFQPQAHAAPIHVLGLLEASGLTFDAVWIMGLDSNTWPAPTQPDPYLPMHIQRSYALPQSSADRERAFSLMHQQQISQGTTTLVVSCAQRHDDIPRDPSVLIADIPEAPKAWLTALNTVTSRDQHWHKPSNIIERPVTQAPPLTLTHEPLPGGSAIVNEQAKCPFRAFALFRLNATEPKTPHFGIDAATQGILVHHALELIWQTLSTQAALLQLKAEKRSTLIDSVVQRVMAQQPQLPQRLRYAHTLILKDTLTQWLALECARTPFRVKQTEQKEMLSVGPYRLRVRLDRVDELSDGSMVMIDYKTGSAPALTHCLPPHATENQLPLYASFSRYHPNTVGFAFGVTHRDRLGWSGLIRSEYQVDLPVTKVDTLKHQGEPLSWATLTAGWKERTLQLLSDFTSGVATVSPAQAALTCRHCPCRPICRIGLEK